MNRTALFAVACVACAAPALSQTFVPNVAASIRDNNGDGQGDLFNATPFEGLLRDVPGLEDRAIQEFDLTSISGALIQSATLSGTVYVNNAFDVGPRNFEFFLYAGNGAADLSDFQIAAISVGTGSYHPPTQISFTYAFDVKTALGTLLSGGAQRIGLKVDCTSNPNYPNILGDASVSHLDVVVATCGTLGTFCTAGTTSNGCNAQIAGSGTPDANAGSGYTISVSGVEGGKQGLLFYGMNNTGFTPQPWGPSTSFLCVKPPTQRMTSQNSGGTVGQCDGALSIDWNAFIAANPSAFGNPFAGGEHVFAQAWFRDPPSPKTTHLSNALEFLVCP